MDPLARRIFCKDLVHLAKQFCTKPSPKTKPKSKVKQKTPTPEALFKFNWENTSLYGPLLKPIPSKTPQTDPLVNKSSISVQTSKPKLTESGIIGKSNLFPLTFTKISSKSEDHLRELANDILQNSSVSRLPSVTNILQKTMSPENAAILERWRKKMIAQLGEAGFAKYQEDLFSKGKALHNRIHNYLQNVTDSDLDKNIDGYWESISSILPEVSNAVLLEKKITHPFLHYLGIVDCVAEYQEKLTLIEWKTSQNPKPNLSDTYDNPIQVAAYMGAHNFAMESTKQIQRGLIVIAYPDGKRAHAHIMDENQCQRSWETWISRLQQFWQFQNNITRQAVIT